MPFRFPARAGPGAPGPETRFVANAPERGAFGVRPLLEDVLGDPRWTTLRAAFAYVDLAGVELLGRANVYEHANRRAVARLLARGGAGPPPRVLAAPRMLHAKALVARAADGAGLALVGSANLKRNSLRWLGELVVVSNAPAFVEALDLALGRWGAASAPRAGPLRYGRLRAAVEDALG